MKYMNTADFEVEFGFMKLGVFSGESFKAFQSGQGGSRELGRSLFVGVGRMVRPAPPSSPMAEGQPSVGVKDETGLFFQKCWPTRSFRVFSGSLDEIGFAS